MAWHLENLETPKQQHVFFLKEAADIEPLTRKSCQDDTVLAVFLIRVGVSKGCARGLLTVNLRIV